MRKWMLALVLMAAVVGSTRPAEAVQSMCFSDYYSCNLAAAQDDDFWGRFAKGLDCNVSLWGCLRDALYN